MKQIPNILSLSRIVLLVALFFTFRHALLFSVIYLSCGLTDILDGYLARRMNAQSALGARLDSIADFMLFMVIAVTIVLWIGKQGRIFVPFVIAIFVVRLANVVIAALKYHAFAMLHTWGNKLAGFLLFITPLFLLYQHTQILWPVCIAAAISALEESLIHLTSPVLDLNRKSIFKF
ncbi:CDP-alcohol phosphatidyltransferase family protein [Caproiciproducens faecalis]|uniref:CDP-alcohol phosphatidyltransferase family protein n=1 Tax=Caproiciproducens faecalis TaxID=2820301 RepID=A0ABS7DNV5_9FIRM|nr:CDP-alcohol phosphatidyltransferase family protein [Caproiciproducens faecalis]MBW7572495.1 CDP-alcohol phosphatidyltransferase family protein [Caproiciproducens faecalis]